MKPISKMIKIKLCLAILVAFFSLKTVVSGQVLPQINARFSNPRYDKATKIYALDVELNSKSTKESLFGMNVRFFYDASMLEFKKLDQFTQGYGILGQPPTALQANGQSGTQMFNLNQATVFVNGAVQMADSQTPLQITPDKWVKVFSVIFKVQLIHQDKKDFCPSVIWDLKPNDISGGFLTGDDGLVITVNENDPVTPDISAPAHVSAVNFNWSAYTTNGLPYGKPDPKTCISLSKKEPLDGNNGNSGLSGQKFALFQNEPNPFNNSTSIEFDIPFPQEVTLKFYDTNGKILSELKGEYKAGRNTVRLDHQPWMEESKIVFYIMQTEGFRSDMLKMTIMNR
jgi:hypothetical protein